MKKKKYLLLEGEVFLPGSARRYIVSNKGYILTRDRKQISVNEGRVCINWIDGQKNYLLGMLVLVSFLHMKLPEHHFLDIVPLHRDSDKNNLSLKNLFYKFSTCLEAELFPDHFIIPGFTGYAISKEGCLVNLITGKERKWVPSVSKDPSKTSGYLNCRVVADDGSSKLLFKHKALAITFLDYGDNLNDLVVNHLDGSTLNNDLSNLEICTYSRNLSHAYEIGLRGDNIKTLVRDVRTNKTWEFRSLSKAGVFLGYSRTCDVVRRIEDESTCLHPDGYQVKRDDGSPWKVLNTKVIQSKPGLKRKIASRNIFTGKVDVYDSSKKASSETGIASDTILSHCRRRVIIPICGYNFRHFSDLEEWPLFTNDHLVLFKLSPVYPSNGIIVEDMIRGSKRLYLNASEASKNLSISNRFLYRCISDKLVIKDRFKVSFFLIKDKVRTRRVISG